MAAKFQAFIDDSSSKDEFVLAGYVAPADTWLRFAKDWEEILPLGTKTKSGKYHFKMSEMATSAERMARVRIFYGVIERYPELYPVSFRLNLQEFANAQRRLEALTMKLQLNVDLKAWSNYFFFAFHALMNNFHRARQTMMQHIPQDEKVDFIFDNQSEASLLPVWSEYVAGHPEETQRFFGAKPRLEDDQRCLALQASDLWAWWIREWYEEDNSFVPDKLRNLDFGEWRGNPRKKLVLAINEDEIFEHLQAATIEAIPNAIRRDFYGPS